MPLVVNGPPGSRTDYPEADSWSARSPFGNRRVDHATRRAHAVVGVDSGPMHLAAALLKPGVAIFGPTDPARNGPYGGSLRVLRDPAASTTYKRTSDDRSMRAITPAAVAEALAVATGCPA